MARCLILGGAGFIGSSVVEALLEQGHEVRVFDRTDADLSNLRLAGERIEVVHGDYQTPGDVRRALSSMDVVVHLINTTHPKSSNDDIRFDITSNLEASVQLLDLVREQGVGKVVFASSGGTIYGIPRFQPITESHPTDPICSYGITKLAVEKYLQLYRHLYGLDYVILRIANAYGERQNQTVGQGALTTFLWQTLNEQPVVIWGDGSTARDYVHVDDVARAFVRVIEGDAPARLYNIGSGRPHTLNEIIELIANVTQRRPPVVYLPARTLDVAVNYLDVSQARVELGWTAKISLIDGIARTWARLSNGR